MNTSVNSETWISVGNRMPSTAIDSLFASMAAVGASATVKTSMLCRAVVVVNSTQITNAPHITAPNHEALSISAATMARIARPTAILRCGRKYLRSCSQEISVA
jgi:hypothetical protein